MVELKKTFFLLLASGSLANFTAGGAKPAVGSDVNHHVRVQSFSTFLLQKKTFRKHTGWKSHISKSQIWNDF